MSQTKRWISFTDPDTGAEAGVAVYRMEGAVKLVISHRHDGDLETWMPPSVVEELIDALISTRSSDA